MKHPGKREGNPGETGESEFQEGENDPGQPGAARSQVR